MSEKKFNQSNVYELEMPAMHKLYADTCDSEIIISYDAMEHNAMELKAEEVDCVHECLNDRGIARAIDGEELSLWGRVCILADIPVISENTRGIKGIRGVGWFYDMTKTERDQFLKQNK